MASARSAAPAAPRPRSSRRAAPPPRARVRWDRLGRMAMLFVLCVLLYLYISPVRSLWHAVGDSGRRQAEVAGLARANARLRAERDALSDPGVRERDARSLGLVRPGEKGYVIFGLPAN